MTTEQEVVPTSPDIQVGFRFVDLRDILRGRFASARVDQAISPH
jgi:hypothetical protein